MWSIQEQGSSRTSGERSEPARLADAPGAPTPHAPEPLPAIRALTIRSVLTLTLTLTSTLLRGSSPGTPCRTGRAIPNRRTNRSANPSNVTPIRRAVFAANDVSATPAVN